MKFSTLNVNFNGPSLYFLGSRKPAHNDIKERYPRKSCSFTVVGLSFVKTVADRHGHADDVYRNKYYSDELFSRINITLMTLKDPKLPK